MSDVKFSSDEKGFIHIPKADVSRPKDGWICIVNRWWSVHSDGFISVYVKEKGASRTLVEWTMNGRLFSLQCNANQQIAAGISPIAKAVFEPIIYLPGR